MKYIKTLILFLVMLNAEYSSAQDCVSDYFSINYQGTKVQKIYKSVVSPNNETLLIGDVDKFNSFASLSDGFITKLTAQGSVLWSKQITAPLYNNLILTDAVALPDGSFIIIGSATLLDTVSRVTIRAWGIVFRIDQYGKLVWTKAFDNYNEWLTVTNLGTITSINDGHFILVGRVFTNPGPSTPGIKPFTVMKMDAEGNVLWRNNFSSDSGYYVLTERIGMSLVNGGNNLVLGFSLYHAEPAGTGYGTNLQEGYYLVNLNYQSGEKVWDHAYYYPSKVSIDLTSRGPIQHVAELPNGDLSFLFSFSDSTRYSLPPFTRRAANMITDANGVLKKVIGYFNTQYGCKIAAALDAATAGERVVLMDDGSKLILTQMDEGGQVKWQKAFSSTNDPYGILSFYATSTGYYIFSSDKFDPKTINLFKTDKNAELECLAAPVNVITEDVTNLFSSSGTDLRFLTGTEVLRYIYLETSNHEITSTVFCFKACCKDTLDIANTKQISLCEGETYVLPNNYTVQDSGMYYVTNKTTTGCDSVSFYHVSVQKNPDDLRLAGDECFEGRDNITLKATPGFDRYNWVNNITTDSSYLVTKPGIYWVAVSNSCGAKRDSTELFDKCDFTIYMPSAFTPNDDGLNDFFRVPPSNQNKFVRLEVYNRWGQKIFETKDVIKGWNGMSQGQLQPVGVYIYFLTMESLNGTRKTKQGTITLVR